jgi:hypothetical protein
MPSTKIDTVPKPSGATRRSRSGATFAVVTATASIVAYEGHDALSVRATALDRPLYAVVVAVVAACFLSVLSTGSLARRERFIVACWLVAATVYALPVVFAKEPNLLWMMGDFSTIMLPVLLWAIVRAHGPAQPTGRYWCALAIGLGLAAIAAPFASDLPTRFEPPSALLMALLWVGVFAGGTIRMRAASFMGLATILVLAYQSGNRTSILLWVAAGTLAAAGATSGRWRSMVVVAAIAVALALSAGAGTSSPAASQLVSNSRFKTLVGEDSRDASLEARFQEAADAADWRASGSIPALIFGGGHGATFVPERKIIDQNLDEKGRSHNIHLGPVLVWFRYGLLGTAILAIGAFAIVSRCIDLCRGRLLLGSATGLATIAAALVLMDFVVRNTLVKPLTSLIVAAFLALPANTDRNVIEGQFS